MKLLKQYKKRGMAAAIAAVSLITALFVPQLSAVAATDRVNLLIAPKTIIGDAKGDYVGWTEFSSDTLEDIEVGNVSGAWYTQKIASTGREWEDYAVFNNQNSEDISGFLWEAAYLKDPGISLKMGVDNTFRHRATSESLKADNGKTEHDCAYVRKTINQSLVTHENCDACVTDQGKYDWSMMPAKVKDSTTGEWIDKWSFYFEDNDTAGLFLNGVLDEVAGRGTSGNYTEQYYTGFVLLLNENPESAAENRGMKSGIYYVIHSNFSVHDYKNGGYKKASDVKSGEDGVYLLKAFGEDLEEQGLVTFGVEKGEEGHDSNKASDNYTDVSFVSELKNGKVTVTATVNNPKTDVKTTLSFTGDADYYRSEGSVGFFSYSQPCATFSEIQVSGIPPKFTITYDADGGTFSDGKTENKKQEVNLYDFEYEDSTKYYYPVPIGTLKGGTVSRTGYHIADNYNTPSKSKGWYYDLNGDDEEELLSTMYYTDYFTEDITVKPAWKPNQLTVKYHVNGGNETISNTVMKYDTSYKLTTTVPTRDGYVFKGWALKKSASSSDTLYTKSTAKQTAQAWASAFGKSIDTGNASVTLYAQWEIEGSVQYHSNSGSATAKDGYKLVNFVSGKGALAGNSSGTVIQKALGETDTTANLHNVSTFFSLTGYHAKDGAEWLIGTTGKTVSQDADTDMTNVLAAIKSASDRLVTLYANWEANSYKIHFDGNGSTSGSMSDMEMTYNVAKKLTQNAYQRFGYTFTGWNTKADGSGDSYTDMQTVINLTSKDGGTVTLYAQWEANTYTIRFHPNGGEGQMDDVTPVSYDISVELPKCSYTKENEYGASYFKGWNLSADETNILYRDKDTVLNLAEEQDAVIILYAIWDDCPGIEAKDLYYTLEQAKNGDITEDELLYQARAFDLEDNEILPGTHENNSFRVIDYQESDFTQFQSSGSVTETYQVIDSCGNTYAEQITVYIVDTTPDRIKTNSDDLSKEGTTRFISEKYYYVPYENGGLESNSIWLVKAEYRQVLLSALENLKNDTPEAVYEFTHEEILQMKEFVINHGAGNTKEVDALQQFFHQFLNR